MKISKLLTEWYKKNARDLPWRHTQDPYLIWISEIILQQTQVKQGAGYYNRFIQKYPDVMALANASEKDVLMVWQGLGYYSRARNLLAAAKQIVTDFQGKLPCSWHELKKLKGIGDYTAGAIASIAFREPVVAIDGNVSRVISRLYGFEVPIDSKEGVKLIRDQTLKILDKDDPGTFNQALMELGALCCKPANPSCADCPLNAFCSALSKQKVHKIPVKTNRNLIRTRWFNYFIIKCNGYVFIEQRKKRDIWNSLFQFPLVETEGNLPRELVLEELSNQVNVFPEDSKVTSVSEPIQHKLTHQSIIARFFELELPENNLGWPEEWIKIPGEQLNHYPFPVLIKNYLHKTLIF
ncbi:MAG: A/G-specific adenine glycosylase [Bacteroidales bacterium]|nr:A/G-specific adenine glycosylase [Bacteroidales bacterium]MBN2698181.1 A/G-specific adenine glycosylase [Bacteroidales bacterium]